MHIKDIFPLMGVTDSGIAIQNKGVLSIGWELTFPTAGTLGEDDYDSIHAALAMAVRRLPSWSVIHRQDLYFRETYKHGTPSDASYLERAYDAHFNGRPYLKHTSYLFVSFCSKNQLEKPGTASGLYGIRGYYGEVTERALDEFLVKCREFEDVFGHCGRVSMRRLTPADWLGEGDSVGIVQRYMMLGDGSPVVSDVEYGPDFVSVHDKYAMMFAASESDVLQSSIESTNRISWLSGQKSDVRFSYASPVGILLDCEHVVNQVIVVPEQQEVLGLLESERRKMVSGMSSIDNRMNAQEIGDFLEIAYREGLYLVKTHFNVMAWGPDRESDRLNGRLSTALAEMRVNVRCNKWNTPVLWYACIPGCAFEIGTENLMRQELRATLCLNPLETFESDIPGGMFRICDRFRRTPVHMDLQAAARARGYIDNYNAFVLGPSGAGKSFFMNLYLHSCYEHGEDVFVIDIGGSYEQHTTIVREESGGRDGHYFAWSEQHRLSFNPFEGYRGWLNESGNLDQLAPGVATLLSFLQFAWAPAGGWTSGKTPILRQSVTDFIREQVERHGNEPDYNPVFDDYIDYLKDVVLPKMCSEKGYQCGELPKTVADLELNDYITAIQAFKTGYAYGFLLNDRHPRDMFDSRWNVFDMTALSKDESDEGKWFFSICILFTMNAFLRKMYAESDRFTVFAIDEAWLAIANETMAPILNSIWKTSRKNLVQAILITQQISDIVSSPILKDTVQKNSSVRVILDVSNSELDFDSIMDLMSLNVRMKDSILSINRDTADNPKVKEVFISLGNKKFGVFRVEVPRKMALAFESAHDAKAPLLEMARLKGSLIRAIDEEVDGKREEEPGIVLL